MIDSRDFGIVQGRLTASPLGFLQWFPQDGWQDEFARAEAVGIRFIELLIERQNNATNPAWSTSGRAEIRAAAKESRRDLYSICTDYVIDHGLLGADGDSVNRHIRDFLAIAADLKCSVAILPLLEESNLTPDNADGYVPVLKEFAKQAAESGITICLESLLSGALLKDLLERVDEPNVKCVFDTGNRVVQNQDVGSEIRLLGGWIQHLHIKDKNATGENVLLGTGLVNFHQVFGALNDVDYRGPLVFETTRGRDPLVTARYHMSTCNFFTHEALHSQPA